MAQHLELDVVRRTLERAFGDTIHVLQGRDRDRLTERVDRAIVALQQADRAEPDAVTAWTHAEATVREVAAALAASSSPDVRARATRVATSADYLRDARSDLGGVVRHNPDTPSFAASRRVPSPQPAAGRGPVLRVPHPQTPSIDVQALVSDLQRSLWSMAGRVATDGAAAFDDVGPLVTRAAGTAPAPPPEAPKLVGLRRCDPSEDTPGAAGQQAMLRRIARGIIEDIGAAGLLRSPDPHTVVAVPHQRRFEARLLADFDALVALGTAGPITIDIASEVTQWAADGATLDRFRPFTRAFVLSCLTGSAAADAAVLAWRSSPAATWDAQAEAFILGRSPSIDVALGRSLADDSPPEIATFLLDSLTARRTVAFPQLVPWVHHHDVDVRAAAAHGLGTVRPELTAAASELLRERLDQEDDEEVVVAILRALARTDRKLARKQAEQRLSADAAEEGLLSHQARRQLIELVAMCGVRADAQLLLDALARHPEDAEAVSWHGSSLLVDPLLSQLDGDDTNSAKASAAQALARMLGQPTTPTEDEAPVLVLDRAAWSTRWAELRNNLEANTRLRAGEPFHPHTSITTLLDESALGQTREALARELVLITGHLVPDLRGWLAPLDDALAELRATTKNQTAGAWLA